MPNPLPLPDLVHAFVHRHHARIDVRLPELLRQLEERRATECWHKHGTFFDHLYGVFRILRLWGAPDDLCVTGLFHSAYSNEFVDLAIFAPRSDRSLLAELVGERTEAEIHEFCVMPRRLFIEELVAREELPDQLTLSERGVAVTLDAAALQRYALLTAADLAEQWFEWQDEVWAGHFGIPRPDADEKSLPWPGPFRPSGAALHIISRLTRHLRRGAIVPPIFERCTAILPADAERRARDLYHEAQQSSAATPGEALNAALEACRANPHVAEPSLLASQLLLAQERYDEARQHAARGFSLLCAWGTPYDKRITWEAWIAWARILAEHAAERRWPARRTAHNNLGLVGARAEATRA